MNHSFLPSKLNVIECSICHKDMMSHGMEATCECCKNIGPVELKYGNMLMCASCIKREMETSAINSSVEAQQTRINDMHHSMNNRINDALAAVKVADESIAVKTDIFNAETTSIIDIKKTIDDDDKILNKPYALASLLTDRFNHFKSVIFDLNKEIVEAGNKQKAIQVYLNNLANQLRVEEREKLKIADINYKPQSIKPIKPKVIKTASAKKLDKVELRKYASELGVPEFTLQMLVVSKGITVETAANMLRKSIAEAKSESAN